MFQYEYVFEHGHNIIARLFDTELKTSVYKQFSKDDFTPPLYIPNKDGEFNSFTDGTKIKKVDFKKAQEFRGFLKNYKESNIPIYGNTSFIQHFIRTCFPNPAECDHDYRTWYIDIEVRSINGFPNADVALEEISLIQIYDTFSKKFIIFGTKQLGIELASDYGEVKYIFCNTEKDMLIKFANLLDKLDPTVLAGFNSYQFDFPYITNRFTTLGMDNTILSPVKEIKWSDALNKDNIPYQKVTWEGRFLLDIQDLYIKYKGAGLPRLTLETVSQHELGEGKVSHDEYFSFEEFYLKDFDLFVEYGLQDVELLLQLENKLKLIDTAKYVAYSCGVNVTDVFGTYKQWLSIIYNTSLKDKQVLPVVSQYSKEDDIYVGGWVFSKPGRHNWIVSFDFASLYPSVIRFANLGVDTLVKQHEMPDELIALRDKYLTYLKKEDEEKIKEFNHNMNEFYFIKTLIDNREEIHAVLDKYNVTMSPNGYFYKKDKKSSSSYLMEKFFNQRKIHKKDLKKYEGLYEETKDIQYKMLADKEDLMQYAMKLLINSFYGAASMNSATFSHGVGYACAVTSIGRMTNRWVAYTVSKKIAALLKINFSEKELDNIPFLAQADTDSNYITLEEVIKRKFKDNLEASTPDKIDSCMSFIDRYVAGFIQEAIDEVAYTINCYNKDVMVMEQETSADKFVSIADKRYFCRKWYKDMKGEYHSGYKMTGISLVNKSTPTWFKEKLKPIRDIILDQTEKDLMEYNEQVKAELLSVDNIKDICVIKSVSSVDYNLSSDGKAGRVKDGKNLSAPLHSRGAIVHNTLLQKNNDTKYNSIRAGDKIFYCYLRTPNKVLNQNVISFINPQFMKDYNITKYVDWDTMYEKNYLKNVTNITDSLGWKLDKYGSSIDEWI